jgi:predicted transposase/invertase (TIGR01784 family)
MKRDDALWKGILEDLFDDFLRFYFPESVDLFNFNRKFVFLDKELEQLFPQSQDDFNPKYVDKLVKVFTKKGKEEWILIHIEVQGSRDKDFAKRMFMYRYRVLDKYDKPITSLAILTDKHKSYKPNVYRYEFMGNELYYKFNTYKVLDANEKELKQSNNPFAVVVRVVQTALKKDKMPENQLFDLKLELVKELLKKNFTKEKIRNLLQFLKLYIRFDNQELINKFEKELDIIKNQQTTMGLEEFVLDRERRVGRKEGRKEGIEEGIEEGMSIKEIEEKTNFTRNLLTQTDFDEDKIALLVGVEIEFVRQVKSSLS